MSATDRFPPLPLEAWEDTKTTLHLFLQMVGKVRMALHPKLNHWWHVTLYPAPRGLTTGRIDLQTIADTTGYLVTSGRAFGQSGGTLHQDFYTSLTQSQYAYRDSAGQAAPTPGFVATKMTKVTTDHPKRLEGALQRIPLHRMGTPADMAGASLFLASPLSSYILGQTLIVDGGLTLN